jgi:MoxR-like ATPase
MKVHVDYLDKESELEVMRRMSNMNFRYEPKTILDKNDIAMIRNEINKVNMSESLEKYIIELVFASRRPKEYGLNDEAEYIQYGASTRASINLNLASKFIAFSNQRDYVLPEDVKSVAYDVLNHRIILNYEAEADGVTTRQIIESILRKVTIGKV